MTKEKLKISIPDIPDRGKEPECPQETPEPAQSSMLKEAPSESTGVGSRLRTARLASKRSLKHVVSVLKIRLAYIQAIEEERYSDLPGSAYAAGFVRSYAEYLGLDHDQIVRDFRAETVDDNRHTDLHFPEPEAKSQTPPVAVAVVSLFLAVALYVSWERWPTFWQDQFAGFGPSEVPAPPPRDAIDPDTGPDHGMPAEVPAAGHPVPGVGSNQTGFEVLETIPETTPETTPAPDIYHQSGPPIFSGERSSGQYTSDQYNTPESPDAGSSGLRVPEDPDLYWSSSVGRFMPRLPRDAVMDDPDNRAPTGENPDEEGPKIYGELDADVRIVIEATQDSWVQIRDTDDTVLLTRVLFPGERFRVPDRPGLSLTTGNAGGLRIMVDGNPAPPIGVHGAVRRDVTLEPDLLYPGAVVVSDGDERQEIPILP